MYIVIRIPKSEMKPFFGTSQVSHPGQDANDEDQKDQATNQPQSHIQKSPLFCEKNVGSQNTMLVFSGLV